MQQSWKVRLMVFIAILGSFLILGNLLMALGLNFFDIDLEALTGEDTLSPVEITKVKWLSTLNHLLIFSASSLVWIFIYYGKSYFKIKPLDALLIILFLSWLLFSFPLIAYSAQLNMMVDLPDWASAADNDSMQFLMQLLKMDNVWDLLINILIIGLVPAIGEELLFRGIMLKELLNTRWNPHLSIIFVSVVFSLFHFQLSSFLPKMVIGLILCYSYYWTRNLMYPIIIHFFNNALQVTLLYTAAVPVEDVDPQDIPPIPVLSIILSAILCAVIVDAIIKRTKRLNEGT